MNNVETPQPPRVGDHIMVGPFSRRLLNRKMSSPDGSSHALKEQSRGLTSRHGLFLWPGC